MKEFFRRYPKAGSGSRARQQALEEVQGNIKWLSQHEDNLYRWFSQYDNLV